jgi:beta-glucosidase
VVCGLAVLLLSALFAWISAPVGATTTSTSRCGNVTQRPWCNTALTPSQRAQLLESAMSTSDKINLLTGAADPDVGVPAIKFTDGALGVRGGEANGTTATALPSGTALAANFDPFDAYLYGTVVGRDAKELGYDGVWGPTVNMMRTPLGGRTYEAYGEDPYLTSETGVAWIQGAQAQGVMADIKHFVADDQEGQLGIPLLSGTIGGRLYVNSVVDDRTLHEIYLMPFEAAVKQGHVATVMCSYNQVNGVFACQNATLLKQILEQDWGFTGFVESDAGAAHDPVANLNNGLDFDTLGTSYNPALVEEALATRQVSMATLNERVVRILSTLFQYGFFDRATYADNEAALNRVSDDALAQWVEEQGITLLQNNDNVLPLGGSNLSSIAVIGSTADEYTRGSGSSEVSPTDVVNPLQAIEAQAPKGVSVVYNDGLLPSQAAEVAAKASVAVVFVRDSETEGSDKLCMSLDCPSLGLPDLNNLMDEQVTIGPQDQMIEAVAEANPNTIVVMETGGPVLTPWRNLVKGVLEAWYPGQEGGSAIASVLFGDSDPGGRLPVTFPASPSQEPTFGNLNAYPGLVDVDYAEGVFIGYRWFDEHGYTPAYPFGSGLSYTTFSYHDLSITPGGAGPDGVATVTMQVTNTGSRSGDAVPELYLSLPSQPGVPQPPLQLKGYQKVDLAPGQTATVSFPLNDRSFAYWDTGANNWKVAPGCYGVNVGSSSADLPLTGTIARLGASCGAGAVSIGAPDNSATSPVLPNAPTVSISG